MVICPTGVNPIKRFIIRSNLTVVSNSLIVKNIIRKNTITIMQIPSDIRTAIRIHNFNSLSEC